MVPGPYIACSDAEETARVAYARYPYVNSECQDELAKRGYGSG